MRTPAPAPRNAHGMRSNSLQGRERILLVIEPDLVWFLSSIALHLLIRLMRLCENLVWAPIN